MSIELSFSASQHEDAVNPLPTVLQTPSGLALLELQGTINLPEHDDEDSITSTKGNGVITAQETPIGRLIFPDYDPKDLGNTAWMKRVYLYVGKHQRLTGQVKKLPNAIAVIRKRTDGPLPQRNGEEMERVGEEQTALEIVEIVKYKILFSIRPEPDRHDEGQSDYPAISSTASQYLSKSFNQDLQTEMSSAISPPECYFIGRSTPHVPNSALPVLVYRAALPTDATPTSVCETIEPNNWLKGGVFKHYGAHHFHSITHECYAGSPHWDNNFCKADENETAQKASNARAVPIPDSDPVFGVGGPLVKLWEQAIAADI
ncbi:hypothetical protein D0Z07_8231 [Hyphodiscus hymeniophilus]|uniref:Uncharacterized protein n=1 Tax=Hyphodiscus hymeniophilus TaxID=353542 RepID=A0A9P6SNR6_9HELO|nr:hypothetical protein D0Z07_8231 [Hyphodiscus hymeniophilus]